MLQLHVTPVLQAVRQRRGFTVDVHDPAPDTEVQLTAMLRPHVRQDRIADVIRRPAEKLGGRSLLEVAEIDGLNAAREAVGQMFDWTRANPEHR